MKNMILFLFLFASLIACKNEPKAGDETGEAKKDSTDVNSGLNISPVDLPDPCEVLSAEEIASLLGVDAKSVTSQKADMTGSQGFSESCSLSWEQNGKEVGLFVQFQKNPLHGEIENYASGYINALVENGEVGYPDNSPNKYTRITGIGVEAAYSETMGKFVARKDDEIVLVLFLRSDTQKKDIKDIGSKLAKAILEKM